MDQSSLARHTDRQGQVVHNALAWYEEHMAEAPGVERIAGAANTSVSHLRRLFHEVLGRSPRDALKARQMERALFLLRNTTMVRELTLARRSAGQDDDSNRGQAAAFLAAPRSLAFFQDDRDRLIERSRTRRATEGDEPSHPFLREALIRLSRRT